MFVFAHACCSSVYGIGTVHLNIVHWGIFLLVLPVVHLVQAHVGFCYRASTWHGTCDGTSSHSMVHDDQSHFALDGRANVHD